MMYKAGALLILAMILFAIPALAQDESDGHVYASIADRVETGEINCCCAGIEDMGVGGYSRDGLSRRFSGEIRFRWQYGDNARSTGLMPWTRVQLNYRAEPWDNVNVFFGISADTEDGDGLRLLPTSP